MKKRNGDEILFPRNRRVPVRIRYKARLWLDIYLDALLAQDQDKNPEENLERAAYIADKSVHLFEERWPQVEP